MSLVQCPTPAGSSDAGHLFDGMPDSVVATEEDRIGALSDDILRFVLSFLPSLESVCTCVLARRWRNLWKSVPTVLIYDEEEARFVTSLLLLRDRVPLHEFLFTSFLSENETPQDVEMWLRYAASCHVRVLRLDVESYDTTARLRLPNMTLVCQHLTALYFSSLKLQGGTLDFSSCPVLGKLQMVNCEIHAEKILCQSLRRLVTYMCIFVADARTRISCPSLTALELSENVGLTPFLESMPSLVTAFVEFDREWSEREELYDHCLDGGYYVGCGEWDCIPCHHIDREGDGCVLLDGLCGSTKLTLISAPTMIICTRDFKWRHIFCNLKTLHLSEWCLAADFSGLVYFVQHSPILERLTVQLSYYGQQPIDRKDETYRPRK
ncbi:F-box/LRR-repeat protein At3g26922-like [Lolium perenne]|uniref:F-box/LRR-repeat protein At3g26922-like n=1 Tax=Lolium perenne TaxID=4522 RepID=UPI003A99C689